MAPDYPINQIRCLSPLERGGGFGLRGDGAAGAGLSGEADYSTVVAAGVFEVFDHQIPGIGGEAVLDLWGQFGHVAGAAEGFVENLFAVFIEQEKLELGLAVFVGLDGEVPGVIIVTAADGF